MMSEKPRIELLKPVDNVTKLDILQIQSMMVHAEAQLEAGEAAIATAKSYLAEGKRALGKMLEPSETK